MLSDTLSVELAVYMSFGAYAVAIIAAVHILAYARRLCATLPSHTTGPLKFACDDVIHRQQDGHGSGMRELCEDVCLDLLANCPLGSAYTHIADAVKAERSMGIKVVLDRSLEHATAHDMNQLMMAVAVHGVVCIPAAHLQPLALKEFADRWGTTLKLPPGLAFNAQVPGLPEVARVGNVQPDGTIKAKHSAAEYWHHDGDFWPVGQNHILNFLCAVEVPSRGGRTGFLDTRKAFLALTGEERLKLEGAFTCVHAGEIEDFKGAAASEMVMGDVAHKVFQKNPLTNEISLYLPASNSGIQAADGTRIGDSTDFIRKIEQDPNQGIFEFDWAKGDLLIWDNTTTMHRSMGGYLEEARLLHRCQARLEMI